MEKKALKTEQLSLVSDSEDDDRVDKELLRRFYGTAVDQRGFIAKPRMRERDGASRQLYSETSYPTLALASPIQSRLAMQAAMLQANSYLSSFDPQRLKRARQNELMRAVSQWRTNPNMSKEHGRDHRLGGKSASPFMNAPRKVSLQ